MRTVIQRQPLGVLFIMKRPLGTLNTGCVSALPSTAPATSGSRFKLAPVEPQVFSRMGQALNAVAVASKAFVCTQQAVEQCYAVRGFKGVGNSLAEAILQLGAFRAAQDRVSMSHSLSMDPGMAVLYKAWLSNRQDCVACNVGMVGRVCPPGWRRPTSTAHSSRCGHWPWHARRLWQCQCPPASASGRRRLRSGQARCGLGRFCRSARS